MCFAECPSGHSRHSIFIAGPSGIVGRYAAADVVRSTASSAAIKKKPYIMLRVSCSYDWWFFLGGGFGGSFGA